MNTDMNRCDTSPLLGYQQALEQLTRSVEARGGMVNKPLQQALGAVLAESIESQIDVPGCAMSAMDGYAINTADLAAQDTTTLPLSQRIAAGSVAEPLAPGTAARIFTGAQVPSGADAVIMQEQVQQLAGSISFESRPANGDNIRPAGNDIRRGTTILSKGCRLRAQDIGLAASIGLQSLPLYAPLKVGIFFTGDELVEPGEKLAPGKIYDSNRYTLYGLRSMPPGRRCQLPQRRLIW
jgi:molybdopterin molybdotransferase